MVILLVVILKWNFVGGIAWMEKKEEGRMCWKKGWEWKEICRACEVSWGRGGVGGRRVLRARTAENIDVRAATTGTSYLRLLPFGFTCFGSWGWFIPWNFLSPDLWLEVDEVLHEVYCSVQWEKRERKQIPPLDWELSKRYRENHSILMSTVQFVSMFDVACFYENLYYF